MSSSKPTAGRDLTHLTLGEKVVDGPTLVIAEKPSTARSIARALAAISNTKPESKKKRNIAYYEVFVEDRLHIVTPAAGHLYGIAQSSSGWKYPVFDIEWKPSWELNKSGSFTKPYLENFVEFSKRCESFISATDYDREGSVIAYNILRLACGTENARRMKFSTLTSTDLIRSYQAASDQLDMGQIRAGLTRHVLDWYWGVNITRALTLAAKAQTKGFDVVSSGRVQGPTLKILTELEKKIQDFTPRTFWTLVLLCEHEGTDFEAVSEPKRIWDEERARSIYTDCKDKPAIVREVKRNVFNVPPPPPFDLTTLQSEAYRHLRFSPRKTNAIAQRLYESALISYPRTSSQKIPPSIGYRDILEQLSKQDSYTEHCRTLLGRGKLSPREGKKTDPAHPAIYPTGKFPGKLAKDNWSLYDLICRRFLSTFGRPAKRESLRVGISVGEHPFRSSGRRTLEANWMTFYGRYSGYKENLLPHLEEGDVVKVLKLSNNKDQTKPPRRYTQASIIKEMEKRKLGTKATRASIVQTLYDRGYVTGRSLEVTELGISVVETLESHCPRVISEDLTSRFEQLMESIEADRTEMESVISKARETLSEILASFKGNEDEIGVELAEALRKTKAKKKEIGPCPNCGKMLRFITSKRTGKRFIGCSGYKDGCRFSAPVPQRGRLTVTSRKCKACGQPMISVYTRGKRPWSFCFNPDCPDKKEEKESDE